MCFRLFPYFHFQIIHNFLSSLYPSSLHIMLSLTWHRERWARLCWGWWHRTRRTGRLRTGSCPLEGPRVGNFGTEHPLLSPIRHFLWPRSRPYTQGTQKSEQGKIIYMETGLIFKSWVCLFIYTQTLICRVCAVFKFWSSNLYTFSRGL